MAERFADATALIDDAISRRAFPGVALEVGRRAGPIWQYAAGTLTYDADSPSVGPDTVYDLASLTKVIATATLAMRAGDQGRLELDSSIAHYFPAWRGSDREQVTVRDLLSHSSGLTAYLPFFRDFTGRAEYERAICTLPLEYPPRTRSIYSDLGFILLGFLVADVQPGASLEAQFRRLASSLTTDPAFAEATAGKPLTFNPPRVWRPITAPTEIDPWRGRLLVGEVHDENTWALGGAAGHAGLFGTAAAVGAFARAALRTIAGEAILANPSTMREFIRRRDEIPGSSRALAWDTMLPTSSCGTRLSASAIGHTGFTGTSLWIDWERDLYVVMLTNRVHPTRENMGIREVRPRLHDLVIAEIVNY